MVCLLRSLARILKCALQQLGGPAQRPGTKFAGGTVLAETLPFSPKGRRPEIANILNDCPPLGGFDNIAVGADDVTQLREPAKIVAVRMN